jgi:peptidoglycan-associated lipoprotein
MHHQRRLALVTLCAAMAISAACAKKPEPPPPTPPTTPTVDSTEILRRREQARQDSINRADAARRARQQQVDDSIARAAAAAQQAARDMDAMRATLAQVVNFDFDKSELRADAKAALDQKLPILNANTGVTIRIAGHTDSRGSGEYNLQLGQRRAAAVRDYLTARGVAASRVELVSYGEERPLCQTQDEGCWSQNRRAEFEITAGGNMLRKPQ